MEEKLCAVLSLVELVSGDLMLGALCEAGARGFGFCWYACMKLEWWGRFYSDCPWSHDGPVNDRIHSDLRKSMLYAWGSLTHLPENNFK